MLVTLLSVIAQLAIPFIITVITEGTTMALLFRNRKFVYYSFLGNLLTNPALNLIMLIVYLLADTPWLYISLALLESAAVLIEAHVYRLLCGFKIAKAFGVSALLNVVSLAAGYGISLLLPYVGLLGLF